MRIILVHMPWGPVDIPSLALGILRTVAERQGHDVHVRFANLDLVDWLADRMDFNLAAYHFYSESSYFQGAGDWAFSSALYQPDPARIERFTRRLAGNGAEPDNVARTAEIYRLAPAFIDHLVTELDALEPDLVGFTTTFQQNAASLAAAQLLKQRRPGVVTVFGGANCDGPQGAALHRNFPFLDFVVRGEGETAFPALLTAIAAGPAGTADTAGTGTAEIPGLCWRTPDGRSVPNPMARRPLFPADIVAPTFDGFFERLDESVVGSWVEPRLVVEGARGCWWGEKHHCTFCGLNGSFMEFRSKSPDRFAAEVLDLARKHQLLDFFVVDNILDMKYFDTALAQLAASGFDFRMQYEVKSNLRRHHFGALAELGAVFVQPGIESLNTNVLRLMDKGVTGCLNIRALRDAESAGVTTTWNYLYGFPGEDAADYLDILEQLPRLHHLSPADGAGRIAIERFSPYFNRPELGFSDLRPAPQYADTYRLPEAELFELAYLFAAPVQGIDEALAARLDEGLTAWRDAYPDSRLCYHDFGDRVVLLSQRTGFDWRVLELTSALDVTLFRLLDQPRSAAVLADRTAPLGGSPAAVADVLGHWSALGIVFTDADHWIQLATEADNQMLMRLRHRHSAAPPSADPQPLPPGPLPPGPLPPKAADHRPAAWEPATC